MGSFHSSKERTEIKIIKIILRTDTFLLSKDILTILSAPSLPQVTQTAWFRMTKWFRQWRHPLISFVFLVLVLVWFDFSFGLVLILVWFWFADQVVSSVAAPPPRILHGQLVVHALISLASMPRLFLASSPGQD